MTEIVLGFGSAFLLSLADRDLGADKLSSYSGASSLSNGLAAVPSEGCAKLLHNPSNLRYFEEAESQEEGEHFLWAAEQSKIGFLTLRIPQGT